VPDDPEEGQTTKQSNTNRKEKIIGTDQQADAPPRKEPIRGTKHGITRLKAAEGSAWLYIGRLSPDTTEEDILEYLSESGVEGTIHCDMVSEKINSKAFKIGIPMHELERIHNSSFWPSDIYCRPFRQPWKLAQ
jgi:hypothetical protein